MQKKIVARKDPALDGINDLEGDNLVFEGLQDLDEGIKGLSLKLDVLAGGLKDLIAHVRGGDAPFRVFRKQR
jgi:hypothetical protein